MTPEEIVLAMKICGNHLSVKELGCDDCPNHERCMKEDDRLLIEGAELIESLLKEVERLKRYEQAIDQILKPDNDEMMGRTAGEG